MNQDAFFTAVVAIGLVLVSGLFGWIIGDARSFPGTCQPAVTTLEIRKL